MDMRNQRPTPGRLHPAKARAPSIEMSQRIHNRVVWALVLGGIAAGLYVFDGGSNGSLTQRALKGPNVRSLTAGASSGCNIKGNISVTGERIYHVPGQTYYAATNINSRRGERWFCFQWQAWLAGWRKARL